MSAQKLWILRVGDDAAGACEVREDGICMKRSTQAQLACNQCDSRAAAFLEASLFENRVRLCSSRCFYRSDQCTPCFSLASHFRASSLIIGAHTILLTKSWCFFFCFLQDVCSTKGCGKGQLWTVNVLKRMLAPVKPRNVNPKWTGLTADQGRTEDRESRCGGLIRGRSLFGQVRHLTTSWSGSSTPTTTCWWMKTTMQKAGHSDILKSQAFEIPPVPIDQNESLGFVQFVQFLSFVRLFVQFVQWCRLHDSLQQKSACWELERVVRVSAWNDWSAFKCTLPRLLQPRISFDANSMQNGSPLLKQTLGCRSCFSCLTRHGTSPVFLFCLQLIHMKHGLHSQGTLLTTFREMQSGSLRPFCLCWPTYL